VVRSGKRFLQERHSPVLSTHRFASSKVIKKLPVVANPLQRIIGRWRRGAGHKLLIVHSGNAEPGSRFA
jgi:hypothetical protein